MYNQYQDLRLTRRSTCNTHTSTVHSPPPPHIKYKRRLHEHTTLHRRTFLYVQAPHSSDDTRSPECWSELLKRGTPKARHSIVMKGSLPLEVYRVNPIYMYICIYIYIYIYIHIYIYILLLTLAREIAIGLDFRLKHLAAAVNADESQDPSPWVHALGSSYI